MYYLFGKEDLVYIKVDDENLTEKEKSEATIILEELPTPPEYIEGKDRILFIDPETLEVSYIYRDWPEWSIKMMEESVIDTETETE